jgi:5-amino-6-(5-phosphoribosylamino)uracil reductase
MNEKTVDAKMNASVGADDRPMNTPRGETERCVRCVMAMSVDGKIASRDREAARFGSEEDQRRLREQVAWADALLMAAGTLRAYGGTFTVRDPEYVEMRHSAGQAAQPASVIVTRSLDLPTDMQFFTQRIPRIIATTKDRLVEALERFTGFAETVGIGSGEIDAAGLVDYLRQRGMNRILLLGGGELNFTCFRAGIVDELYLTISPLLFGGRGAPSIIDGEGFDVDEAQDMSLESCERIGTELFLEYRCKH